MYKLAKLKSWLELKEASKQLSAVFDEKVKPKDILKLALDGHLTLSVYFPNTIKALKWKIVPIEQARTTPSLDGKRTLALGFLIGDKEVLDCQDETIYQIDGLWDLSLIGAERLDIEHAHLLSIKGPAVEMICLDGVFVHKSESEFYQLQSYEEEHKEIDEEATKAYAEANPNDEVKRNFFKTIQEGYHYPMDNLPDDSLVVVKPSSISALINRLSEEKDTSISSSVEGTYQSIIAALLDMLTEDSPRRRNQSAVVSDIIQKYGNTVRGFSKRNLDEYFKEAKKTLMNRTKEN